MVTMGDWHVDNNPIQRKAAVLGTATHLHWLKLEPDDRGAMDEWVGRWADTNRQMRGVAYSYFFNVHSEWALTYSSWGCLWESPLSLWKDKDCPHSHPVQWSLRPEVTLQAQSQPGARTKLNRAGPFLAGLDKACLGWPTHPWVPGSVSLRCSSVVWIPEHLPGPVWSILKKGSTVIHIFSHGLVTFLWVDFSQEMSRLLPTGNCFYHYLMC